MASDRRMLPSDFIRVLPKFYLFVVRCWSNDVLRWMEANPVASAFMPIEDLNTLDFNSDKRRDVFCLGKFLLKNCKVPNSHSWVQRPRNDEILLRMKLSTHYVVTVAGYDVYASSALIVPNSHRLIITSRQNPRKLMMKVSCADVVDMPLEREYASLLLIVPNFHECIVSSWNKQRQLRMEV